MYLQWYLPPGQQLTTPLESLLSASFFNSSKDLNFRIKVYAYKIKEKKPIEEFHALDSYEIKNRGTVYIVKNPKAGYPRKRYVGKKVLIDGAERTVKAIELFMINLPYPEGWTMGLLT